MAERGPEDRSVERLIADEILPAFSRDGAAEAHARIVDAVCDRHPQLADAIRRRVRALQELGLLESTDVGESAAGSGVRGDAGGRRVGSYRLLEPLGFGGQGSVYRAEDPRLGREVAIKVLATHFVSPRARLRIEREAQALSRVAHPGICDIYEVGEEAGIPFLAMRLVEGQPLASTIGPAGGGHVGERVANDSSSERQTLQRVARLGEAVARALHAAHMAGLVHRDVKPANIIVTPGGDPVLVDFGLVRDEDSATITQSGDVVGTPAYMSPEQRAGRSIDRRTDVYALGATLYEAVTGGRVPGEREVRAPSARRANQAVSVDFDAVLRKAMAPEAEDRYPTAWEFAEDLAALAEMRPVSARRDSVVRRVLRWAKREPVKAALAAVVSVTVPTTAALVGYQVAQRPLVAAGEAARRRAALQAVLVRGFNEFADGKVDDSRASFDRALGIDAASAEALAGIALGQVVREEFDQALATLDRAGEGDRGLRRLRALVLARAGRSESAQVLERELGPPRDAMEFFAVAMLTVGKARAGDVDAARAVLDAATQAMQRAKRARQIYHFMAARAAELLRDPERAVQLAAAIEAIWPDSAEAQMRAGVAYARFDSDRALACYRRAVELAPDDHQIHAGYGTLLVAVGDSDTARKHLRKAVELYPQNAVAHTVLGVLSTLEGDPDAAIVDFRAALQVEPDYEFAHQNLLEVLDEAGRKDEAAAERRRWAERRDQPPGDR